VLCCFGDDGDASSGSGAAAVAATFRGINGVAGRVGDVVSVAVGMMREAMKIKRCATKSLTRYRPFRSFTWNRGTLASPDSLTRKQKLGV
jgi:hypothetical protein